MTKANVSRSSRGKTGGKAVSEPCPCCGIAPDPLGRPFSITYDQPDVAFEIEPELLDTWGEDPFFAIKNVGFFVRVLMPVRLTDGFSVSIGTWLEVDAGDFRRAWQTWNSAEYADLVMEGYLANAIAPWVEFPHELVRASVRDVDQVPYLTSSGNELMSRILGETWPHAQVLLPYAHLLKADPPVAVV